MPLESERVNGERKGMELRRQVTLQDSLDDHEGRTQISSGTWRATIQTEGKNKTKVT